MTTLCIVPCGKRKIWNISPDAGPQPARNVYIGPFATRCRMYAERFYGDSWVILSVKHGFLFPDDIVPGPYETTFNRAATHPISPADLARLAKEQGIDRYSSLVVLGGKQYISMVMNAVPEIPLSAPLEGSAGIGVMMQRLNFALSSGIPLDAGCNDEQQRLTERPTKMIANERERRRSSDKRDLDIN
jgi:hypothetical protein